MVQGGDFEKGNVGVFSHLNIHSSFTFHILCNAMVVALSLSIIIVAN